MTVAEGFFLFREPKLTVFWDGGAGCGDGGLFFTTVSSHALVAEKDWTVTFFSIVFYAPMDAYYLMLLHFYSSLYYRQRHVCYISL